MGPAKAGDTVRVHYTGKLEDGTVFDSSWEREPLAFQLGAGQIIPGFEKVVEGMTPGDKTTTLIPAAEAYGPRSEQALVTVPRSDLPPEIEPQVGQRLQMQQEGNHPLTVEIIQVDDDQVTLDANHPLAGKDLSFDIELVAIQ